MGRDAFSAGDHITAESFYQHAEHYYRLVSAADANGANRAPDRGQMVPVVSEPAVETGVVEPAASEAPADEAESAA